MRNRFILFLSFLVVVGSAWGASSPSGATNGEAISRFHWLGMTRIAADPGANNFLSIWNERDSRKLEAQTLDKLSTAPWRLLRGLPGNNDSGRFRPLLDDLVSNEWYAEIKTETNRPVEMALAVHLDPARQGFWDANLSSVMESLTAIKPERSAGHWSLKKHHFPDLIESQRAGQWLILGAAQENNPLMQDMLARIQRDGAPAAFSATNSWLEADFDPAAARVFAPHWQPPPGAPRIAVRVIGNGTNIETSGKLTFAEALPIQVEPWDVPTNLIERTLTSITAARGVRPFLAWFESSAGLNFGPPPNQVYFWSLPGLPAQEYFAAPVADASSETRALLDYLVATVNPMTAAAHEGSIVPSADYTSADWQSLPFLTPSLQVMPVGRENFLWAGSMPFAPAINAPSLSVLKFTSMSTNLVYYNSENTGPRTASWLYILQLMRMAVGKAQLPGDSTGAAWLKNVATKLGSCLTTVELKAPDELSFDRKSTVGFTALELQVLMDWQESPAFPHGLNTFTGQPHNMN